MEIGIATNASGRYYLTFDNYEDVEQVRDMIFSIIAEPEPKEPDCGACSYKKELIRLEGLQDERVSLELEVAKCWERLNYWSNYPKGTNKVSLTPTADLSQSVSELIARVQYLQSELNNAPTDK